MSRIDESLYLPPVRSRAPSLHESWYSLWSSLCLAQPFSRKEVLLLAGDLCNRHMLDPATRRLLKPQLERLLAGLGIPRERTALLCGADMDTDPRSSGQMHVGLRHCSVCLSHGYHSSVFQHLSIDSCPLHTVPLRTTCPNCQFELNPTWLVAAMNPFGCPRCDVVLVRGVRRAQGDDEIRLVDALLGARREVIIQSGKTASRVRACIHPMLQTNSEAFAAAIRRHVQRQAIWMREPRAGWLIFRQGAIHINETRDEVVGVKFDRSVAMAIGQTLGRIRELYRDDEDELLRLQAILGRFEGGRRLTDSAGVVSCAILKTEYILGVAARVGMATVSTPLDALQLNDPRCQAEQRGAPLLPFEKANALLVEYEVLALFCVNLWKIARLRRLSDIAWSEFPHPAYFRPEWCLDDRNADPLLLVRPRATWDTVRFLLKRYSGRMLR